MRSPEHVLRHIVHIDWRCKHCREIFGSENVSHYGVDPPNMIKPTWFFASMALLDHLRDCQQTDLSEQLRAQFGEDFLNHVRIFDFYNIHALLERKLVAAVELED
jgi:hypothetical protein